MVLQQRGAGAVFALRSSLLRSGAGPLVWLLDARDNSGTGAQLGLRRYS